jgi:hypothetical protein
MANSDGTSSNPNGTPGALDVTDVFTNAGTTPAAAVDTLLLQSPTGSRGTNALGNAYFGINHRQTPAAIPINKDHYGLTFFTRPNFNLTLGNLRSVRLFNPLTTTNQYTLQRIIRCYLDPRSAENGITSPFVDPQQAFMPLLSNALTSISGWQDVTVPYRTSQEGVYKEVYSQVDGVTDNYTAYDITANFRNIPGDPITALFFYWAHYMSQVFQGNMVPYPESLIENEIDYNTRIYRLVLDPTKTKVQKIAACGAAFPYADPMGASFNYSNEKPYNDSNQDLSVPFHCVGAIYQDPILLYTFNQTVCAFNDTMTDTNRSSLNTKIPMGALQLFNNRGYPRINPDNWELEWWIDNQTYQQLIPLTKTVSSVVNNQTLQQVVPNVNPPTTGAAPITNTGSNGGSSTVYTGTYTPPTINPNSTGTALASLPITQLNA